jgi:hypothetical protein
MTGVENLLSMTVQYREPLMNHPQKAARYLISPLPSRERRIVRKLNATPSPVSSPIKGEENSEKILSKEKTGTNEYR